MTLKMNEIEHFHQTREAISNHLLAYTRKDSPDVVWLSIGTRGTRVGIRKDEAHTLATWLKEVTA